MTYFNRGGGFGGDRSSNRSSYNDRGSSRGGFSSGSRDSQEMSKAVCAECGRDCQVPFRPSGSKPVYCSSCFEAQGGGNSDRQSRGNDRSSYGDRSRSFFDSRPRHDSNERFSAPRPTVTEDHLRAINIKLDKIMELLTKSSTPEDVAEIVDKKVSKTKQIKKLIKKSLKETEESEA